MSHTGSVTNYWDMGSVAAETEVCFHIVNGRLLFLWFVRVGNLISVSKTPSVGQSALWEA